MDESRRWSIGVEVMLRSHVPGSMSESANYFSSVLRMLEAVHE